MAAALSHIQRLPLLFSLRALSCAPSSISTAVKSPPANGATTPSISGARGRCSVPSATRAKSPSIASRSIRGWRADKAPTASWWPPASSSSAATTWLGCSPCSNAASGCKPSEFYPCSAEVSARDPSRDLLRLQLGSGLRRPRWQRAQSPPPPKLAQRQRVEQDRTWDREGRDHDRGKGGKLGIGNVRDDQLQRSRARQDAHGDGNREVEEPEDIPGDGRPASACRPPSEQIGDRQRQQTDQHVARARGEREDA